MKRVTFSSETVFNPEKVTVKLSELCCVCGYRCGKQSLYVCYKCAKLACVNCLIKEDLCQNCFKE